MKREIWKQIDNYEDYIVSNMGRVAKILKGTSNGKGYRTIIFPDGNRIYKHQLVARAFIPNPNNLPIINHKDGNKSNNNIENLEWCNHSHNIKEAYRLGLHKPVVTSIIQKTLEGKEIKRWESLKEAEKMTGISYQAISKCCSGKSKTSGGYKWEYQSTYNYKEE